jgi:hypothetical protein
MCMCMCMCVCMCMCMCTHCMWTYACAGDHQPRAGDARCNPGQHLRSAAPWRTLAPRRACGALRAAPNPNPDPNPIPDPNPNPNPDQVRSAQLSQRARRVWLTERRRRGVKARPTPDYPWIRCTSACTCTCTYNRPSCAMQCTGTAGLRPMRSDVCDG